MANWIFREIHPNEVETEITQRDQFRNDDVDLSDTVVREAVQNSLDAAKEAQVRVRFDIVAEVDTRALRDLFVEQFPHADAAGIDVAQLARQQQEQPSTALVIEDFGTSGLTGATDTKDDDNFSDFWRRHGRSHKSGKSGGRWGLGKLVYSYSSRAGAFFGLTVRSGDPRARLMGQTVLNTHQLEGIRYAPHGFFADEKRDAPDQGLQIPFSDPENCAYFSRLFRLERRHDPGLSIIIPWPVSEIDMARMVYVGVENYFFPILTDHLVLEVGGRRIDRSTIRDIARGNPNWGQDRAKVYDFVEAANNMRPDQITTLSQKWYDDGKLSEADFSPEVLDTLRRKYREGELIGVRLNIELKRKDGSRPLTSIDLYLKADPDLEQGHDLYVRGGITVPGEAKFRHRKAMGALVGRDEAICGFLGDAENAAHTKWNGRAEKLNAKYRYGPQTLSAIRNSLVQLCDLLAQAVEEEDRDALIQFFSVPRGDAPRSQRPGGNGPGRPVGPITGRVPALAVHKTAGGFRVVPAPNLSPERFPLRCVTQVAYDVPSGNPFRRYEKFDFEFGKSGNLPVTGREVRLRGMEGNRIDASLQSAQSVLEVSGFDPERDIVIRVTEEEG